jgi:outer membrane lipoprotein-sorting protein
MTFGTQLTNRNRSACAIFFVLALAFPSHGAEPGWGLTQLMIELGRVKQAKATFVERKYLKVLNAPLESSGKLIYTAPYLLEKHTLAPKPESMVVDHDVLTLEMRGRKRVLQIQDYPVLWAFVESIRGTLKGDLSALQQFYRVKLDGTRQEWQLQLQPTEKKMAALIQTIAIRGSKDRLNGIEIIEADGDRSVMTVTDDISASITENTNCHARNRMDTASQQCKA